MGDLWNSGDRTFLRNKGTTQLVIGKLEDKYIFQREMEGGQKSLAMLEGKEKLLLTTNDDRGMKRKVSETENGDLKSVSTASFKWKCFRCNKIQNIGVSTRARCNCGKYPRCEKQGCEKFNLSECHDEYWALIKRKSDWTKSNTQGVQNKEKINLVGKPP